MLQIVTKPIRKIFNAFGYEIIKQKNLVGDVKIEAWLQKLNISTIIDVGSNEGQFIEAITKTLPGKRIIAFEPIKGCYDTLVANTKHLNVTAFNCGLSDYNGTVEINVSKNLVSSSILSMESLHENLYPHSKYTNKEIIELKILDEVIAPLSIQKNVLLKIDVQGYEEKVLAGSTNMLKDVAAVIIEFSYQPLYQGQWLFDDTYKFFIDSGFKFAGFKEQAFSEETNIPIYGDAIFIRKELANKVY